jgi:CRP-like cAMP-binding protein
VILRNEFLRSLPESERAQLLQAGRAVQIPQRFTFYFPGDSPEAIYFLETGMASELVRMSDGKTMDASPIGRRGLVGAPALLGAEGSFHHCVMQVPGEGHRVPAGLVKKLFETSSEFREIAGLFLHARFAQATQCAACNLLHRMEQRLARWLLITRSHTGVDEFQISQEYLSEMVGANRSTVTTTLHALERPGMVELDRSIIRIRDVDALSEVACECYRVTAAAFDQIGARAPQSE